MPEDRLPPKFNRNPMLWLGLAFALGILLASVVSVDLRIVAGTACVFTVVAFVLRSKAISTSLILVAFVFAGTSAAIAEKQSVSLNRLKILYDNGTLMSGDPVEVEGVLLGRPESSVDGAVLNLAVDHIKQHGTERKVSGNVRLYVQTENLKSEISDLKYGSRLRIATKLERDDEFLNPGVIPKREILDRIGVDATGAVKSPLLIEKIADESVFLPLAWVYDQRAKMIESFRQNLSGPSGGVMIASLLGNKQFLDKDTADLFREGGTFHILVISGLHITFIGGLLLLFLRRLTPNRWIQFSVTTSVLWAYTLAVGADVPVVRAALMSTVMLFSYSIYRRSGLLNSLGFCGLVLLVWRPSELFNSSFQLTFVSVAAIIAVAYPLIEMLRNIGGWMPTRERPFPPDVPIWLKRVCETIYWSEDRWRFESKRQIWTANIFKSPMLATKITNGVQFAVRYIFEGILVSLIVQICMLPLSVVYFHRVSLISVVLNLWVGLFIALESFAAVLGVVAGQFSELLARGIFAFAELFNWLMLSLPRLFSDNSWLSYRPPAYSGNGRGIYLLFFIPVVILAIALSRWRPFDIKPKAAIIDRKVLVPTTAVLAALIAAIIFHPLSSPRPDSRLHVDFLDVGQGDSALVTFPDGRTMLVDGGGQQKYKKADEREEPFVPDAQGIGESVVSAFLWHRGYSRIDFIVATHADADHIQGLTDVVKNFSVGSAIFGRMPLNDPDLANLVEVLKRRGIGTEIVERGDVFEIGGASVEVLFPAATDDPQAVSNNDSSVVLRLVYGSRSILLTGDIEQRAERELTDGTTVLSADVVKVPHHGSRTSSTAAFVEQIAAKYAVISVGRTSPFGHPHPEVVERWKASGSAVSTAGARGTITVSTDGTDLVVTDMTTANNN
ncbi:MAG: ComEC/Rec2 family competence protein [Pyrinomonadaceae bacterium]